MSEGIESFAFDIKLRHPLCDPAEISDALGLNPWGSAKAGQETSYGIRKSTMWMCHFRKGLGNEQFGQALEDLLAFLDAHAAYIERFSSEGGGVELTLSQYVGSGDGTLVNLRLEPFFLKSLADHNVALRLQAWSAEVCE